MSGQCFVDLTEDSPSPLPKICSTKRSRSSVSSASNPSSTDPIANLFNSSNRAKKSDVVNVDVAVNDVVVESKVLATPLSNGSVPMPQSSTNARTTRSQTYSKRKNTKVPLPNRHLSAFDLYVLIYYYRDEHKEQLKQFKTTNQINKHILENFRHISEEERVALQNRSVVDKERYLRELANYNSTAKLAITPIFADASPATYNEIKEAKNGLFLTGKELTKRLNISPAMLMKPNKAVKVVADTKSIPDEKMEVEEEVKSCTENKDDSNDRKRPRNNKCDATLSQVSKLTNTKTSRVLSCVEMTLNAESTVVWKQKDVWEPISSEIPSNYVHACSEVAMKALLHIRLSKSGSRMWVEGRLNISAAEVENDSTYDEDDNSNFVPEYDHPSAFLEIPKELMAWSLLDYTTPEASTSRLVSPHSTVQLCCIVGEGTNFMSQNNNYPALRMKQKLLHPVVLPSSSPTWCRVSSLAHLKGVADLAAHYQRMLMVVCSHQGPTLWEPMFAQWAAAHPRIMFASIDTNVANSGCPYLREELLGFRDQIYGLSFMSHIGERCESELTDENTESSGGVFENNLVSSHTALRHFNGNNVDTAGIQASLLTRFRIDLQLGLIPSVEAEGMSSEIMISPGNAYRQCISQLLVTPLRLKFAKRVRDVRSDTNVGDITALIGSITSPYLVQDNSSLQPHPSPTTLKIPLRPDQQRSLSWMLYREGNESLANDKETNIVHGVYIHSSKVNVPPLTRVAIDWRLEVDYRLRGGVLADSMGFGKTAIVLALIAETRENASIHRASIDDTIIEDYGNEGHGLTYMMRMALEDNNRCVKLAAKKSYFMFASRATLVVVPPHLLKQWHLEFTKFFGSQSQLKIVVIYNISDVPSAAILQDCDLVVVSQRLFMSDGYKRMLNLNANHSSVWARDRDYLNQVDLIRKSDGKCGELHRPRVCSRVQSSTFPLEKFVWHRVVYDEVHELSSYLELEATSSNLGENSSTMGGSAVGSSDAPWLMPLRCLESEIKWGLTGTPLVQRCADIHSLGGILGVHIGYQDVNLCKAFVDKYIRSSSITERQWPEPREKIISFPLCVDEKLLYMQRSYEWAGRISNRDPLALRELLLTCSHHSLRGGGAGRGGDFKGVAGSKASTVSSNSTSQLKAEDEVTRVQRVKEERLSHCRQKAAVIREKLQVMDNIISRASSGHDEPGRTEDPVVAERKRRSTIGRRDEAADQLREINHEIKTIEKFLDFFRSSLEKLRSDDTLPECPICMDKLVWGSATITPCGHIQCVTCAVDLINKHGKCATCRVDLEQNQWRVIQRGESQRAGRASGDGEIQSSVEDGVMQDYYIPTDDELNAYSSHGSKIAHITAHLKHIQQGDPTAKVLIYCQWDALKIKLMHAFREVQLGCLTLDGNPKQIASAVDRFSKAGSSNASDFILLCSLEHKAAGLNLQVANHVMFVHPFFSPIADRPTSWEAQAVGRVLRPGQKRQVTIWRFVALETIEQELLVRNNTSSWRDHCIPRSTVASQKI